MDSLISSFKKEKIINGKMNTLAKRLLTTIIRIPLCFKNMKKKQGRRQYDKMT
jgi:hypothetical protein